MNDTLKNFTDFLKSEKGKKSMQEFANKLVAERKIKNDRFLRTDAYLKSLSTKDFKALLSRIMNENGDKQVEYWHKRNIEAMPTQKCSLLFEYLFSEVSAGKRVDKKTFKKFETGFSDIMIKYRGYIFMMFFGQGTAGYRIYKKDEIIFGF